MTKPTSLASRLTIEIDAAYLQHRVTPDTMLEVEARDEIERLTAALGCCAAETERLFRWINETRGEKILEIVRKKA
jgi:hypothetical protein